MGYCSILPLLSVAPLQQVYQSSRQSHLITVPDRLFRLHSHHSFPVNKHSPPMITSYLLHNKITDLKKHLKLVTRSSAHIPSRYFLLFHHLIISASSKHQIMYKKNQLVISHWLTYHYSLHFDHLPQRTIKPCSSFSIFTTPHLITPSVNPQSVSILLRSWPSLPHSIKLVNLFPKIP